MDAGKAIAALTHLGADVLPAIHELERQTTTQAEGWL